MPNGHGTGNAGIVGAIGNNGEGISGVNWKVSLMGIRFARSEGFNYATMMKREYGVNVVSIDANFLSGGGAQLELAVLEAEAEDILVITAAGNGGVDIEVSPTYPASYLRITNGNP